MAYYKIQQQLPLLAFELSSSGVTEMGDSRLLEPKGRQVEHLENRLDLPGLLSK